MMGFILKNAKIGILYEKHAFFIQIKVGSVDVGIEHFIC
jgi:hypothetical protein